MRRLLLATTLLTTVSAAHAAPAPATSDKVTAPETVFGNRTGSDYYLADYTQMTKWLKTVAAESSRMKLISIGKTAEGREQYMAVVSSPENLAKLDRYKEIAKRLARAKGLTDEQARALAKEGKPIVWIDAGLHATEVVPAQTHPQIIHEMLTRNDEETLRELGDEIILFPFANPDGLELVADWYMRPADKLKRRTETIPTLYQKYVGHDDNRDSYASNMPETTNINRASYREWFPDIVYNEHQTGPTGTVVFIPPFRDYPNFNFEPLVINQTDALAYAMHGRLIAEGKPGSIMRSGAPYSTWFNGGIRTVGYFHNALGILTEIIGNPTPMQLPLVPENQLAREDIIAPVPPQTWHFQQSLDYMKSLDRAVIDWASRNSETIQYNRYVMGRNQIRAGSGDSWVITPKRIAAVNEAAKAMPKLEGAEFRGANVVDPSLYQTVLHDPAERAPRAYIIPADTQPDMPTTVRFLNSLIKLGVEVQRADDAFSFGGKNYPAGSFVVRTDQAFRPHVLDMFEPQDHPQDFAYPGGPPNKPYDITGYNLSWQMNVKFDRVLDGAPRTFPLVPDEMAPPPGRVVGDGRAGWIVSHATNNSFTLTNRLMKAHAPVYWLKAPTTVAGQTLAPGALWIPAGAKAGAIVASSVGPLGIDAYAVAAKPAGEAMAIKPVRIGLVDVYGGSMASGWTRWIFEQFEFPYTKVFPQELDRGGLNRKYDALVFQSDVIGREGSVRRQPAAADIPAEFRPMLGAISKATTYPQVAAFAKAGGTVITIGNAGEMGESLGLPISYPLTTTSKDGTRVPLPSTKFYIPGSILSASMDVDDPLAYGMPATADVFFYNSPVFAITGPGAKRVAWFTSDDPLRSGWAWGQKALNGTTAIVDATLGRGHVFLIGPEATSRAQPHGTFKLLFNGLYYGPATAGR